MPRISPRNISLSVLVIGDAQAKTSRLIKKFVNADSEKELPPLVARRIPFDVNNVDMCFTSLDTDVDNDFVANADVILFCYNANEKTSYDAILNCFRRIHKGYQGITALVGCMNEAGQPDPSIARLSGDLNQVLRSVYPGMYLDNYISRNYDVSCGVSQLILNFIADKALKLNPAEPVVKPAPKKPALIKKTEVTMQALILGETSASVLAQITSGPGGYQDARGGSHYCMDLDEKNIHLMLNLKDEGAEVKPKHYPFAVLCFDLTKPNSIDVLSDEIKLLVQSNNKIFFSLLGSHGDLQAANNEAKINANDVNEKAMVFAQTLGEMYPYHFTGIYFDVVKNKEHNLVNTLLGILCQQYFSTQEEERALVATFKAAHRSALNSQIFTRTTVTEEDADEVIDIDVHIHNASRSDLHSRSRGVFEGLGWFDKNGMLCKTTPTLIEQRRRSLDMSGADYSKKLTQRSKMRPG
jgi:hypothetical protein